MIPMPSCATMMGFNVTPFAVAADISVGFARRELIATWAVPSMIAAMPVVDPSAAISNDILGYFALNSSASVGTSFAPKVSDPLMTSFSGAANAAAARARKIGVFIAFGFRTTL